MSTIKVNKIENTSTTAGGIEVDTSGHVKIDGQQLPTAGPLSNRRININGDMAIHQRGAPATATNGYGVDRYTIVSVGNGSSSVEQDTDAPPGFSHSVKWDISSAYNFSSAADQIRLQYRMEGYDAQRFGFGTSEAKTQTVSFWIKSSTTGTFAFHIWQQSANRIITKTYTIDTADTWEYKSLTFEGDVSSTIPADNGGRIIYNWVFGVGSGFVGNPAPSWEAYTTTNFADGISTTFGTSTSDYVNITGVQIELGSKSTPFEHRSYGDELQRCERYFQQWKGDGTTSTQNLISGCSCISPGNSAVFLKPSPKMRGPFDVDFSDLIVSDSATYDSDVTSIGLTNASGDGAYINVIYGSQGTRADAQSLRPKTGTSGYLRFDAEL